MINSLNMSRPASAGFFMPEHSKKEYPTGTKRLYGRFFMPGGGRRPAWRRAERQEEEWAKAPPRLRPDKASGEGHIVAMERNGSGVLMAYNPQSGAPIKREELDRYLARAGLSTKGPFARGYYPPDLLRVDDLDFDKEYADEIMREAST